MGQKRRTIGVFFFMIVILSITLLAVGNRNDRPQLPNTNKEPILITRNFNWYVYQINDSTLLYVPYRHVNNMLRPYTEKINNSNYETQSTISIEGKGY